MWSRTISKYFSKGVRSVHGYSRIGNREVVGHGCNGMAVYKDDAHFPFPAIRFKENSPHIEALRRKEKGDWKLMTKSEKKALYRASFCQTYSEFQASTGMWKLVLGGVLITTSFSFWSAIFFNNFVRDPLPDSVTEESQLAQLQRMLDLKVNPIDGLSSGWDYENKRWK